MGGVASKHDCKPQTTVPEGKIRICVAGYWYSPYTGRSHRLANHLAQTYPETFESWFYWSESHGAFFRYIIDTFDKVPFPAAIKGHASSPLVWLEVNKRDAKGSAALPQNAIDGENAVLEVIGGNAEFQRWIRQHTRKGEEGADLSTPFEALSSTPQLSEAEQSAGVSKSPSTLFFRRTAELESLWNGINFFCDVSHVEKYGPQTAAASPSQQ